MYFCMYVHVDKSKRTEAVESPNVTNLHDLETTGCGYDFWSKSSRVKVNVSGLESGLAGIVFS